MPEFLSVSPYALRVLTVAGVYALAAIGWQIVFGRGGALSLAHGTFFGLGAYVTGILGSRWGLDATVTLPLSIALPAVLAWLVALPVLRLESHYFALATLGVAQISLLAAINLPEWTGGANGLAGVPGLHLAGWRVARGLPQAAVVWGLVGLGALLAWQMQRGWRGLAYDAMCDNPIIARSLGLDVGRLRLEALVLSAAYAGGAGALAAHTQRVVSPEVLEFPVMVTVLTMVLIGGRHRVSGAILGAVLLTQIPEWFRAFERAYLLLYGGVLLLVVIVAPWGLLGGLEWGWTRLTRHGWPLRPRQTDTPPESGLQRPAPESATPLPATPRPAIPGVATPGGNVGVKSVGAELVLAHVSKRFGGVVALDDLSLTIAPGSLVGLIGANGSGKTTLVNCITGLESPDSGTIHLGGVALAGLPPERIARCGVARSFQAGGLPADMCAVEAVAVACLCTVRDRSAALAQAQKALAAFAVAGLAARRCGTLPPGERRRVEMARALARSPRLLLLDEPAAGLDMADRDDLAQRLRTLAVTTGSTLLIVEHTMPFLRSLVDRLICLDEGRILADGPPALVCADLRVQRSCLG